MHTPLIHIEHSIQALSGIFGADVLDCIPALFEIFFCRCRQYSLHNWVVRGHLHFCTLLKQTRCIPPCTRMTPFNNWFLAPPPLMTIGCKYWPKISFLPTAHNCVCLLLSWWPHANAALPHPSYRRYRIPWDRIGKQATHPNMKVYFSSIHVSWFKIRVGSFTLLPLLPDQLAFPPPPLLPVTIRRPPPQLLPILGVAPTSTRRVLARLHLKVPS